MIQIKRIYEKFQKDDGYRILIDRLWPRGVSKEKAHLNLWLKDIAPSSNLRVWFGHDPKKWKGFISRYKKELRMNAELVGQLKALQRKHRKITLLYGAHDTEHNEAIVLAGVLK